MSGSSGGYWKLSPLFYQLRRFPVTCRRFKCLFFCAHVTTFSSSSVSSAVNIKPLQRVDALKYPGTTLLSSKICTLDLNPVRRNFLDVFGWFLFVWFSQFWRRMHPSRWKIYLTKFYITYRPCFASPPAATDCNSIIRMLFYRWQYFMPACYIVLQLPSTVVKYTDRYVMCEFHCKY